MTRTGPPAINPLPARAGFKITPAAANFAATAWGTVYAALTGKKPGIVLIVGPDDGRFLERLRATIAAHCLRIDVWEVKK